MKNKVKKKKKLKKKALLIILLIILLIVSALGFIICSLLPEKEDNHKEVIEKIDGYGYKLESNQPKIYKELFEKLTKVLNKEQVDEKEYAELISQMFAIDFYNLDNKISKNDVGGTQFIASKYVDNFALKASDTVYKYVKQNIYDDRKQELPEVKSSNIKEVKNETFKYGNLKDEKAYVITVNLTYKKDLDYPEEVTLKLFHNNKKLEIYDMK